MVNIKVTGMLVAVAVVLVGAALALWQVNSDDQVTDERPGTSRPVSALSMHAEYPDVPEDNRYLKESAAATIERYTEGAGIIFLGFKECPWCQRLAPLLNEAAEAEDVDIYYLDIRQEQETGSRSYRQLVDILEPYLPTDESGSPRISVPDVSFVKDGEIFWRYEMDQTTPDERTPDNYWTGEREQRAIDDFREQMKNL